MLSKPTLSPKAGYVERIDSQGNHYYVPTAETLAKQEQKARLRDLQDTMNILLGANENG